MKNAVEDYLAAEAYRTIWPLIWQQCAVQWMLFIICQFFPSCCDYHSITSFHINSFTVLTPFQFWSAIYPKLGSHTNWKRFSLISIPMGGIHTLSHIHRCRWASESEGHEIFLLHLNNFNLTSDAGETDLVHLFMQVWMYWWILGILQVL